MRRRDFAALAASTAAGAPWQHACPAAGDSGPGSPAPARTLLDHQGPRCSYEDPAELDRRRRAITGMVDVQRTLREFPLDPDEPPVTIFRRG